MKKLIILTVLCGLSFSITAQEEEIKDLNLDELVAVDLEKSSMPINVDSVKALSGNTINLGLLLPMSTLVRFSEEMIQGAQLAVDEINASGKIMNKELFLIPADDASETSISTEKATILAKKYKVAGLMGPTISSSFIKVVNQVLPNHPMLVISPTATSIEITTLNDGDLAFRTAASDALQGKTAGLFSVNNLKHKTAAIYHIDDAYGKGLAQEFKNNFEASGGKVIGEDVYSPLVNLDDYDVTNRLGEVLKSKPEVLYLVTTTTGFISISHQIDKAELFKDYKPTIIVSDAVRSDQILLKGNANVQDGMYCTSFKSIQGTPFEEKFEARYGQKPKSEETADAYDIVYLFALALLEGQSTDPKSLSKHLRSVSGSGKKVRAKDLSEIRELIETGEDIDYDGINSSLDFDVNGDVPDREYQMWQISDGKFIRNPTEIKLK